MYLKPWLAGLGNRVRSRRKNARKNIQARGENLEPRTLLTVTALLVAPTELIVVSDRDDDITVQADLNGDVQILDDGAVLPFGLIPANSLTKLEVFGGDSENTIDVSNVTSGVFTSLLSIELDGGDGNDMITGSNDFGDLIGGNDGDDTIIGGGGDDTLDGDDGNDSIIGGTGNDSLKGGDGADEIVGGLGLDTIAAGSGDDVIDGGLEADSIDGGQGDDNIIGNDGDDNITGGSGNDIIAGGDGADVIVAGAGNDIVDGNDGNDVLFGQSGNDEINGGQGDDNIEGDGGNDSISGGDGDDFILGDMGNDVISGDAGSDNILGGGGNDEVFGGDGPDTVLGQGGRDTIFGGFGSDQLNGGTGNDLVRGLGSVLSISDVTVQEADSGFTMATLTVTLAEASDQLVTFDFTTVDRTAVATSDYTTTSGQMTFNVGETSKDIVVPIVGDLNGEGLEQFFVDISNVVGSIDSNLRGTITVEDLGVDISIVDVTQNEGAAVNSFQFTVSLNTPSSAAIMVDFDVASGNAVVGTDVVGSTNTLTFAPGITTLQVSVDVNGDAVGEDDERFFVNLSNAVNAVITDAQGIGTILDDDGGPGGGAPLNYDRFAAVDASRWTTTATDGSPGLVQGDPVILTWGIAPEGTQAPDGGAGATAASDLIARLDLIYSETATGPDVTNRTWFPLFESIFDRYSQISGLTFVFEPNDDGVALGQGAAGTLGVRPDIRIAGRDVDGNSNVLAFNFFPNFGDMVVDTNDDSFLALGSNSLLLRNVLTHEIGHGLGQPHVTGSPALMNPIINLGLDGPQEIDILSTQRTYGDILERAGGNDTVLTATPLGAVTNASSAMVMGNSIDDVSDIDIYEFQLTSDLTVSIDLTPNGTTFLVGPQVGMVSTPGTTFNGQTLSDLGLELIDSDGVTVLADALVEGFGETEQIVNFSVPVAGTYFVRLTGTANATQAYSLSLAATTVGLPPTAPGFDSDTLSGNTGSDTLIGSGANDLITGGSGNDRLFGFGGDDLIIGEAGNDTLEGGEGNDTLDGGSGNDVLDGGVGANQIIFNGLGSGTDVVIDSVGSQSVFVNTSNQANVISVQQSSGLLQIAEGSDSITASDSVNSVVINSNDGDDTINIQTLSSLRLLNIAVNAGDGNDTITGTGADVGLLRIQMNGEAGNDVINGTLGKDIIDGGDDDDLINGAAGNDTISGGNGNDVLNGEGDNDSIDGGIGNDTIGGGDGNDSAQGGFGNDFVNGDAGNDTVRGGQGDDIVVGSFGNDLVHGDIGNDSLFGGTGADSLDGGNGSDFIRGHSGSDQIKGGDGNDEITGDAGNDIINGGDGNDIISDSRGLNTIAGGDGDDIIIGGNDSDTIIAGDGDDMVFGGGGRDLIFGNDGDDTLRGNSSKDRFNSGEGDDSLGNLGANEVDDESLVIAQSIQLALDALTF